MAFEEIKLDTLCSEARNYVNKNNIDYNNSKSIDSFWEANNLTLGLGVNDIEELLISNYENKKSSDMSILKTFAEKTEWSEKQRIISNCSQKIKNFSTTMTDAFNSFYDTSNALNDSIQKINSTTDSEAIISKFEYIKDIFSQMLNTIGQVSTQMEYYNMDSSQIEDLLFFVMKHYQDITNLISEIKDLNDDKKADKIKEFVDSTFNKQVTRWNPVTNDFVQTTVVVANCIDTDVLMHKYKQDYFKDISNIELLQRLLQDKDTTKTNLIRLYTQANGLTKNILMNEVINAQNNATNIKDYNAQEVNYNVRKEEKTTISSKKIIVIVCETVVNGAVSNIKYYDLQGRKINKSLFMQ